MKVISVKTRAELNQQAENLEVEIRQLEVSYYRQLGAKQPSWLRIK